jgi:hypothetical protein
LLRIAENNGIDVLLTGDQTLNEEQNLTERRLAAVALSAIQLPIIKKYLPKIIAAIDNAAPGSFQAVDCGTFSRKKPGGQCGDSSGVLRKWQVLRQAGGGEISFPHSKISFDPDLSVAIIQSRHCKRDPQTPDERRHRR